MHLLDLLNVEACNLVNRSLKDQFVLSVIVAELQSQHLPGNWDHLRSHNLALRVGHLVVFIFHRNADILRGCVSQWVVQGDNHIVGAVLGEGTLADIQSQTALKLSFRLIGEDSESIASRAYTPQDGIIQKAIVVVGHLLLLGASDGIVVLHHSHDLAQIVQILGLLLT